MTHEPRPAPSPFLIRCATLADVATLAEQRVAMYLDMQELPRENAPMLLDAATEFFTAAIPRGDYIAWLAASASAPQQMIGGAGMLVRRMLPRPSDTGISHGFDGQISSVYVAPAWRRQGLAGLLMRHVLDYARTNGIERLNPARLSRRPAVVREARIRRD